MRLLSREKINAMSLLEKERMIDTIKSSNLTTEEKEANLKLLKGDSEKIKQILKDIEESAADIDDME